MDMSDNEFGGMVAEVWTSLLGLEVQFTDIPTQFTDDERLCGCVQLTGAWKGTVTIDCPLTLAQRATAAMFGMEPEEVSSAEMHDALGELTNIIAGNFKPRLPSPCHLSLPTVVEGSDFDMTVQGVNLLLQAFMQCEGEPFQVAVLQENEHPQSTP